jgi:CheY-like chemotaxis protein
MTQELKDFFIQYNNDKPLRILIVDDDKMSHIVVEKMLVICGFLVEKSYDGLEALIKIRNRNVHYDFVLMDIHMPNMDGLTATREIKSIRGMETLPIFALTGDLSMQAKMQVISAGMSDYFNKPLDIDRLLVTIKSYL